MANSLNKVILIGRLGKDPEVKALQSGKTVTSFSIATEETWKQDGEKKTATEWHSIKAWDRLAEICGQYLIKGKQVFIEGSLKTRSWEDKEGNKRSKTEIRADKMIMLGSPSTAKTDLGDSDAEFV